MYNFLVAAHDGIRWIVVLLAVIVLIKTLVGWLANQDYTKLDRQLWLGLVNSAAIQLLLGLVLVGWLLFTIGFSNMFTAFGAHVVFNITAIAVLMYAARFKKLSDVLQHRNKFFAVLVSSGLIYFAVLTVNGWPWA